MLRLGTFIEKYSPPLLWHLPGCTLLGVVGRIDSAKGMVKTTSWSPRSRCVYGPENEIAAITFFREK